MIFKRLKSKFFREVKSVYCIYKYSITNNKLKNKHKNFATIFFDYEGEWAKENQMQNSVSGVNKILDILNELDVKATFNTVGKLFDRHEIINRIIADNHEISSHTFRHTSVEKFSKKDLVSDFKLYREYIKNHKIDLRGFRAPQSKWNFQVLNGLIDSEILWDAENDIANHPYIIKEKYGKRLWRIPVRVDDWVSEGKNYTPLEMYNHWIKHYNYAVRNNVYFSVGFHPWVLAKDQERIMFFEQFLKKIKKDNFLSLKTFGQVADYYESIRS